MTCVQRRIAWLIGMFAVLAAAPLVAKLIPVTMATLPLVWISYSLPLGGFMILALWVGIGRSRLAWRVVGFVAGLFLAEEFIRLGPWGRLLGFCIALAYFGILNGKLAGGRTVGKRLLEIKVVGRNGEPLGVHLAFIRFLPLGAAWFLNGAQFSEAALAFPWIYVLAIAVFGIGSSIVYLYVFNRKTRQSLHDLLVRSYVVNVAANGPVDAAATWKGHLVVCAILVVASGVAPYFLKDLAGNEPFATLAIAHRAVNAEPWVVNANVSKGQTFTARTDTGQSRATWLSVNAVTMDADVENVERAKRLVTVVLSADKSAADLDVILVVLLHGYDIGIASSWRSHRHAHPPAEWLAR